MNYPTAPFKVYAVPNSPKIAFDFGNLLMFWVPVVTPVLKPFNPFAKGAPK